MSQTVNDFFERLWGQYIEITPSAKKIHRLLGKGDKIINDHVAFRTFNLPTINLDVLSQFFIDMGYQEKGQYEFKAKKLNAKHFEHSDYRLPKIFISELKLELCSEKLNSIVNQCVSQIENKALDNHSFMYSGRHWNVSYQDYITLLEESEYAAWLAAFGFRANHFTVSVNHLVGYMTLSEVNQVLKDNQFILNSAGGEIKGSPEVMLEQSSTLADKCLIDFIDLKKAIPACFYEFAYRYPQPDGSLYQGFVEASADKIFESTHSGAGD
ncbi:DUF1338 domain-containing protein [Alkalimarinus alittae]|uniref:2-oxoadipate dioxygenase/decarboxylase n=1 Tax=Alkalimarinus alittae TaxID=2961619 RepID=A0ABY6N7D0_9ALTE|nr:DUF1338 domain-containing protein [Alkalimarinus alittae]UZE98038.1 DUF1338 domain-containing protein [Alkalimarinus alittae]